MNFEDMHESEYDEFLGELEFEPSDGYEMVETRIIDSNDYWTWSTFVFRRVSDNAHWQIDSFQDVGKRETKNEWKNVRRVHRVETISHKWVEIDSEVIEDRSLDVFRIYHIDEKRYEENTTDA